MLLGGMAITKEHLNPGMLQECRQQNKHSKPLAFRDFHARANKRKHSQIVSLIIS